MNKLHLLILCLGLLLITACGSGGGGDDAVGTAGSTDQKLLGQLNAIFPFDPAADMDVTYICQRSSGFIYYIDINPGGSFGMYTTDTASNDQSLTPGTYTYQNGQLNLIMNDPGLVFNETTTSTIIQMGMIVYFKTPDYECVAYGHGYNDQNQENFTHYSCPAINIAAVSYDENGIEFAHNAFPFNFTIPGALFRQRDVNVTGTTNPFVYRGYGIYRRVGDEFYLYFPTNPFRDFNVLTGRFSNGDQQIIVDQLEPSRGPCLLR